MELMKQSLKQHGIVIIAFLLPVVFVAGVVLFTYIPNAFVSSNYNFIYSFCYTGDDFYSRGCEAFSRDYLIVSDGRLVENLSALRQDVDNDGIRNEDENYDVRVFLHDTQTNRSKEISLEEAKTYSLDSLVTSPDGYNVGLIKDSNSSSFLFPFHTPSRDYYLKKGNAKKKLDLVINSNSYYPYETFRFLGWVLPEEN